MTPLQRQKWMLVLHELRTPRGSLVMLCLKLRRARMSISDLLVESAAEIERGVGMKMSR
jgi:hypothetical protein